MLIRCEKCSTLYELDERLLPPQGAPVQCSKCQFVFKAYPAPPRQAGALDHAANEQPAPDEGRSEEPFAPQEPEPPRHRRDEVVREGGALARTFDRHAARAPATPAAREPTPAPRSAVTPVPGGPGIGDLGDGPVPPPRAATVEDEPRFTADGRPIRKVPFPVGDPPQSGPRTPAVRTGTAKARSSGPAMRWAIVAAVILAVLIAAALAWRALGGTDDGGASARAGQSRPAQHGGTATPPARN